MTAGGIPFTRDILGHLALLSCIENWMGKPFGEGLDEWRR